MWTNDFEGEACLELCLLPGVNYEITKTEIDDILPTELYLTNPKSKIFLLTSLFKQKVLNWLNSV